MLEAIDYPESFVLLGDHLIDQVEMSPEPEMEEARYAVWYIVYGVRCAVYSARCTTVCGI